MTIVLQNFIDGTHRPASSGEVLDIVNPATGAVIADIPLLVMPEKSAFG